MGHALEKVDGAQDASIGTAVNESWKRWQSDRARYALFHEFIEAERNILFKEYEQRLEESPGPLLACDQVFEIDDLLFVPLSGGPFAGEDIRDIARDAIIWWHSELELVDSRADEIRASTG